MLYHNRIWTTSLSAQTQQATLKLTKKNLQKRLTVPLHRLWHWIEPSDVEMKQRIPCITIVGYFLYKQGKLK